MKQLSKRIKGDPLLNEREHRVKDTSRNMIVLIPLLKPSDLMHRISSPLLNVTPMPPQTRMSGWGEVV